MCSTCDVATATGEKAMRKRDELTNEKSCMSRARDDEMTFVLLERDIAVPATIRFWVAERIRLGKNVAGDPQVVEAERCADFIAGRTHDFDYDSGGFSEPPKCRKCGTFAHGGMPVCSRQKG